MSLTGAFKDIVKNPGYYFKEVIVHYPGDYDRGIRQFCDQLSTNKLLQAMDVSARDAASIKGYVRVAAPMLKAGMILGGCFLLASNPASLVGMGLVGVSVLRANKVSEEGARIRHQNKNKLG